MEKIRQALLSYAKHKSLRKTAADVGVGKSTVHRWWKSFHLLTGIRNNHQKRKRRKTRKSKYADIVQKLKDLFAQEGILKYYTLSSIREALSPDSRPSLSSLCMYLRRAGISRRRFSRTYVCGRTDQDMLRLTKEFADKLSMFRDDQVVCLDETGFCNIGYVSYGYFPKGEQPTSVRVRRRERYSVIAAVHPSKGVLLTKMQHMAYDKTTFLSFIDDLLSILPPTVKAVIMDNVSFHRNHTVRERFANRGVEILYIPPYSPRCNPIEEVFSLVKHKYKTSDDFDFTDKVCGALEYVKNGYKDFYCFYRHTRKHVAECLGSSNARPPVSSNPKTLL